MANNKQVMEWLSRYKESMVNLSLLADRIATIRSKVGNATGSGINLNDAGKCSVHKASDPIADLSYQLQELQSNYNKLIKETSKLERETTNAIYSLPNQSILERDILINKYLYFYPNEKNYKSLNLLKKTFEYHLDIGHRLLNVHLIETHQIIEIDLNNMNPEQQLLSKLIN